MSSSLCEEYIVRPGDTIESISISHDVTFTQIKKHNRGILQNNNNRVYPGLKLLIPIKSQEENERTVESEKRSMKVSSDSLSIQPVPDINSMPFPIVQLPGNDKITPNKSDDRRKSYTAPPSPSSAHRALETAQSTSTASRISPIRSNDQRNIDNDRTPPPSPSAERQRQFLASKSERFPHTHTHASQPNSIDHHRARSASLQLEGVRDFDDPYATSQQDYINDVNAYNNDDGLSLASLSASPILAVTGFLSSWYGQAMSSFTSRSIPQAISNQSMNSSAISDEPLSSYTPNIIGEAKILTTYLIKQLQLQIPESRRLYDWTLLYSMLDDGTDLTTFYRRTARDSCTLLVVQTLDGYIFGGYTQTKWQTALHYYGSGESFVFKVNRPDNMVSVYQWSGMNELFMWSTDDRVAMGGGGDGFAFVLDNYFISGETCCSKTYNNPVLDGNSDAARSSTFRISNIEVWGFQSSFA